MVFPNILRKEMDNLVSNINERLKQVSAAAAAMTLYCICGSTVYSFVNRLQLTMLKKTTQTLQ